MSARARIDFTESLKSGANWDDSETTNSPTMTEQLNSSFYKSKTTNEEISVAIDKLKKKQNSA